MDACAYPTTSEHGVMAAQVQENPEGNAKAKRDPNNVTNWFANSPAFGCIHVRSKGEVHSGPCSTGSTGCDASVIASTKAQASGTDKVSDCQANEKTFPLGWASWWCKKRGR